MKRLLSLAAVALMALSASAQVTWNAKGGIGLATCYGDETFKTHLVGKIGGGIEYPLSSNISLMPSLEVAWKGAKFEESVDDFDYRETIDLFYVQVPVMAAYRLNLTDSWNLTLKAGPYFGYAVYSKGTYEVKSPRGDWKESEENLDINKFDAGLDVGIDFEHHRFVFGLEAEMGLVNMIKSQGKDEDYSIKNLAFYATVGWKI